MRHHPDSLYATKAENPRSYGPKACIAQLVGSTAHPVQRPLARRAFCCRSGSWPTMASSETVRPSRRLIFFVRRVFALRPRVGWCRQLPQFAPLACDTVPSSVPRRSCRVPMVVSSPAVLAFAVFIVARQPHLHARRFPHGHVTRLQGSLYATARYLACPSPARTFTIELSPGRSPQPDVDYNYTANNQLPQPDFHRQGKRPYGLQMKDMKEKQRGKGENFCFSWSFTELQWRRGL